MSLIQKVLFLATGLTAALSIQAQPQEPPEFFKVLPYKQVFKDMVLARCLAQVSTADSAFSTDAGFSAYALMQWIPLDIETGNEKGQCAHPEISRSAKWFFSGGISRTSY